MELAGNMDCGDKKSSQTWELRYNILQLQNKVCLSNGGCLLLYLLSKVSLRSRMNDQQPLNISVLILIHTQLNYVFRFYSPLSWSKAFPTRLHLCTVKTPINLRIRLGWSWFLDVHLKTLWMLGYQQSAMRRLWSDLVDAQVDMSLRWALMQSCRKCCGSPSYNRFRKIHPWPKNW